MPKVQWTELASDQKTTHLLEAELAASFLGGRIESDPFDSQRLREGVNLMTRVCSRLKLRGAHSATTSRAASASLVLCLFENREDRDRVADLAFAHAWVEAAGAWASWRTFALTAECHRQLVVVGGETDNRYAGRRRRDRERAAAEQTLRWGDL